MAPYTFKEPATAPDPSKLSWDLTLVNGNTMFPEDHAQVRMINTVSGLRVSICLNPANLAAGSYTGSLNIAGNGVTPVALPLTVNLKDNGLLIIWIGLIAASILAVFLKWWTVKIADKAAPNGLNAKEFLTWLRAQWVTVTIAVVGAAGGVYISKYIRVEDFAVEQRWGLWVSAFAAVMSASMLLNALGIALEPKKGSEPKVSH